jgi:multicomponent Na+:H+ antiporter subunit G
MTWVLDILSWALLLGGCAFMMIGGLGVLRFPDIYARLHAASLTDTAGAGLIVLGLMLQGGWSLVTVKLALILGFLFFTSPTSTHALARTALASGHEPQLAPKPGEGGKR